MSSLERVLATFRNGGLELSSPVDWPEGTGVEVVPLRDRIGMDEEEWPNTPDGVRSLLNRMDEAFRDDAAIEFSWD
jgi:hypothetical protein